VSARPGEWHLLCHDRDPVPGDPDHVDRLARGYEEAADDVERLAGRLRRLSDLDGWTGDAAEKFAESADDLADDLGKAERRYRDLAAAVRDWVAPLRRARDESAGALREAEAADDEMRRHSTDPYAGIAEPTPAEIAAHQRWQQARADAAARKRQAQGRLDGALRDLDTAAGRVAERIRSAAEHGADSWWDNAKGSVRSVAGILKAVVDILGYVAMVLAAITLVVVLVASAPVWLIAAGVGIGLVMAGLHTALVVSESGEAALLLACSTVTEPVAEELVVLFDAIAASLCLEPSET
jgi:uncharacterized protein YukE